jgi:beta-mannosidase
MLNIQTLNGDDWQLTRSPVKLEKPDWRELIPCAVPGNLVADLFAIGLVPDPYYGENFRAVAWVAEWTFWYRKFFEVEQLKEKKDNHKVYLNFDGIDTFAEIYVNGTSVGKVHNMFMRHRFDVTPFVRHDAENELVVRIDPVRAATQSYASEHGFDIDQLGPAAFGYPERTITRKAQMSYGWDQTPHLLAGGIYRNISLQISEGPYLGDWSWHVDQLQVETRSCLLYLQGEVIDADRQLNIEISGQCKTSSFSASSQVINGLWELSIPIRHAELWWPLGLGEANLYDIEIKLIDEQSTVFDVKKEKLGLRTVEVVTEPRKKITVDYRIGKPDNNTIMDTGSDEGPWTRVALEEPEEVESTPFIVKVNGQNVFLKGFDWQNPEILFGTETPEKIEKLLDYAVYTHSNCLRLWGGATIEIDEFYQMCSEKGLLVWQDFYFACAIYPVHHPIFQQEIKAEAADMIKRLRNHTCVAMWCGDNESDMIYFDRGIDPETNTINKKILPELLAVYDKQKRYYHPSSPSGGPYPRSDWGGDKRNWGACSPYGNYKHIRQENARIMSEGGYYVLPSVKSIRRFLPKQFEWPLNNMTWALHNGTVDKTIEQRRFVEGIEKCITYFEEISSLEQAVEVSQFAHAWGTKLLAERCRQIKYECGGVLLWKLNASWPCADGMVVDYYLEALLSLEYMREAYKPVSVSITQYFADPKADVEVYVSNDLLSPIDAQLDIFCAEIADTGELTNVLLYKSMRLTIEANISEKIGSLKIENYPQEKIIFGSVLQYEDGSNQSVGLFSLEPRAIYKALKVYHYDQQQLCVEACSLGKKASQSTIS